MINKIHLWQGTFTVVDLKGGICDLNPSGVLGILKAHVLPFYGQRSEMWHAIVL